MRLINPGAGEKLDRLSILTLKLLHKGEQAHWTNERNALLAQTQVTSRLNIDHLLELAAVNAALWEEEDRMRRMRTDADLDTVAIFQLQAVAHCAFRIQQLNDRRAELVTLINVNAGENLGNEKG